MSGLSDLAVLVLLIGSPTALDFGILQVHRLGYLRRPHPLTAQAMRIPAAYGHKSQLVERGATYLGPKKLGPALIHKSPVKGRVLAVALKHVGQLPEVRGLAAPGPGLDNQDSPSTGQACIASAQSKIACCSSVGFRPEVVTTQDTRRL